MQNDENIQNNYQIPVSIIVPFYNAETYLAGCIQSIQRQTFTDWELLLIDDGSSDQSQSISLDFQKGDRRIQVYRQENKGVSAARNLGLELAKGASVMFVDADDRLQEDMLETMHSILLESLSDMVLCSFQEISPETATNGLVYSKAAIQKLPSYQLLDQKEYLRDCLLNGDTRCWSKLFCNETIGSTRFREGITIGEDLLFLVDLLPKITKAAVTGYAGYQYTINQAGAMNTEFRPSYLDQITCWQLAKTSLIVKYPEVADRLDTILMISIMLVAGKLARLPKKQRQIHQSEIDNCQRLLRTLRKNKKAVAGLDAGYRLKTCFFAIFAKRYLSCYDYWKK